MIRQTDNSYAIISEIYQETYSEVKRFFLRYTHDTSGAEDMAQDLFMRLLELKDTIVWVTARSLIFTTAKRMVIDSARRAAFIRRSKEELKVKAEKNIYWNESESLECKQIRELELKKLDSMPPKMAKIYRLTRFEDKTADELAEEMHISKRTVEYHLYVSRREMRKALHSACME